MTDGFQRRRGGGAVATFNGFEADLLRSLASQLVELLRNEIAAPSAHAHPREAIRSFEGPTTPPAVLELLTRLRAEHATLLAALNASSADLLAGKS